MIYNDLDDNSSIGSYEGTGQSDKDLDQSAISSILSTALEYYTAGIRNVKRRQRAVIRIAKSLSEDAGWIKVKSEKNALSHDGILRVFFNETSVALLLDSILNPRPAYRKESGDQCYSQWVEACNPLFVTDEDGADFDYSFRIICKHFESIKNTFNRNELQAIGDKAEQRVITLCAVDDRAAPESGSFLEYVRSLSHERVSGMPGMSGLLETPLIGLSAELAELKMFCFSDRQLTWWSVSGRSGAGKSRLAAELCRIVLKERKTWYCVFIPHDDLHSLAGRFNGNWFLDRNLLIVVDCPGFYSQKLGEWINQLIKSDTVNRKIRILILEREGARPVNGRQMQKNAGNMPKDTKYTGARRINSIWFQMLNDVIDEKILQNLCFKRELSPLELKHMDYENHIELLNKLVLNGKITEPDKMHILDLWMKLDPHFEHTPVFMLIISAVINSVCLTECKDTYEFLDAVYQYENNRLISLINAGSREDTIFIAAILSVSYMVILSGAWGVGSAVNTGGAGSTGSAGMRDGCVGRICAAAGLKGNSRDMSAVINAVNRFCGYAASPDAPLFRPIAYDSAGWPDLFKGYFVAKTLNTYGAEIKFQNLIMGFAWENNAYGTANFLRRVIDDYYYEYTLFDFLIKLNILYDIPDKTNRETAAVYSGLMVYLSMAQDAEGIGATASRIERLRNNGYVKDRGVALRFSQILLNLSAAQDSTGEVTETAVRLAKLRSKGFSKDKGITLRLYKSLYNLILYQDRVERKDTVKLMDMIRNQGFEYDRDMALILAQSLFILTAKQDEDGINNTVERLEELRGQGFEQDRDITLELIKALLNLTTKQDEAGRKASVARMEALRDQGFGQDRDITLELVKALLNLTIKQEEAGMEKSLLRMAELRGRGFEDDKDMAQIMAQGLLNLTTKQDETGILSTVAKLESLRNRGFEGDRDITLELATALFNLTTRQDESGIRSTVRRIEELRDYGFTNDRDITLRLAQALFSLTTKQGAATRKEASSRIDALRNQGFEQDREITLALVKSLYNLSIEQDPEGTRETVTRIEEICGQGYAQDKEIKLLFAKSLFNLTTKLDESGIAETVSRLETLRNQE